ncbi:MAG: hypothetical protein NXI32_31505 [bacterium]|nr:hypothetical protein [bacterium]
MNADIYECEDGDDQWVRTDIAHDTASSLGLTGFALGQTHIDKAWWKWAIVSVHMASATALVGYLTASDSTGALDTKSTKKWRLWHDHPHPRPDPPERRLADFRELLKRALSGACGSGEPVDLSDLEVGLHRLNAVRNGFNHFDDHGWSIYVPYVVPLVRDAVNLVQRIETHGWAFRSDAEAVRVAADQADRTLAELVP